jgi:hypothetical protein
MRKSAVMPVSRREVLRKLGGAATVAALSIRHASAAEPPHLGVKDPAAVAVGYVENASQVDAKKYPDFVRGSSCENCLQLQGAAGTAYRPCTLFPGKLVAAAGWCSAWAAEI